MSPRPLTKAMLGDFSLEKYAELADFHLYQWQLVVASRCWLWSGAPKLLEQHDPPSAEELDEWERIGIKKIWPDYSRDNIPLQMKEAEKTLRQRAAAWWTNIAKDPLAGARDPKFFPMYTTFRLLPAPGTAIDPRSIPGRPPGTAEGADAAVYAHPDAQFFGATEGTLHGRRHPLEDVPAGRKLIYLEVDMNNPNDILIRKFAEWLDYYRTITGEDRKGIKGAVRPQKKGGHTALWLKWRVVPYIDLRIGAMMLGVTLPDELLRTELFPDKPELDTNAWDNFKDTLKKHVKEFLESKGDEICSLNPL